MANAVHMLKKLYVTIRYIAYGSGALGLLLMLAAKFNGNENLLTTGFLLAGVMFILFLLSYIVYGLIRKLAQP